MSAARIATLVRLDLIQRVRSVAWYVLLGVFAFLLLIVTILSFLAFSGTDQVGEPIYSIVIFFVLLLVVLVSPTFSGNAINGDREAAILAPVQVTSATTGEIVLGKFLAAWAAGLAFLVVAVPFVGAATLAGGVSPVTMLVSLLIVFLETGVVAAIGVGFSGILGRPLFSVATTYLVVAALVIGTLIAFGLGGATVQSEVVTKNRSYVYGSDGMPVEPLECGPWEEYTYSQPRFDYVWGFLAANPFVILADATPARFDAYGNPVDLFGQIAFGVRYVQIPPDLEYVWDECDQSTWNDDAPTPEEIYAQTVPSWFVGLGIHVLLAVGLLWWAWARTRTPARRLPPGTRIA